MGSRRQITVAEAEVVEARDCGSRVSRFESGRSPQGVVAQSGERRRGTPKVAGSRPADSTLRFRRLIWLGHAADNRGILVQIQAEAPTSAAANDQRHEDGASDEQRNTAHGVPFPFLPRAAQLLPLLTPLLRCPFC